MSGPHFEDSITPEEMDRILGRELGQLQREDDLMRRITTDEINADPQEVQRLRRARQDARALHHEPPLTMPDDDETHDRAYVSRLWDDGEGVGAEDGE